MAVNNTCSIYRILVEWNRIKPEAQLKDIHAGFFTGLDYLTHTHEHAQWHHKFVLCQAVGKLLTEVSANEAALPQLL